MKTSNANAFITALQNDAKLRHQFNDLSRNADPHELVALANYHGYKLTFEELNEASIDSLDELSEAELNAIGGGLKAAPCGNWGLGGAPQPKPGK